MITGFQAIGNHVSSSSSTSDVVKIEPGAGANLFANPSEFFNGTIASATALAKGNKPINNSQSIFQLKMPSNSLKSKRMVNKSLTPLKRLSQYGDDFSIRDSKFFCRICSVEIDYERKFLIDQHIATKSHRERKQKAKPNESSFIETVSNSLLKSDNRKDLNELIECFIKVGIPLESSLNENFAIFLNSQMKVRLKMFILSF